MEITWHGHASFLITTAKGIKIITDPYEPGAFGGELLYDPVSDEADIVTVSHDHADHNYVQGLPGKPQVIKEAGRHVIKGIVVEGFSAFHDASQGSQRGANIIRRHPSVPSWRSRSCPERYRYTKYWADRCFDGTRGRSLYH
jgi:hypothetical protein